VELGFGWIMFDNLGVFYGLIRGFY
jgi:hypothetical protein